MTAGAYDFTLTQGEEWRRHVALTGLDATGRDVRMQLRRQATEATVVASATVTIDEDGAGFFLVLDADTVAGIGAPGADTRLVHDVWVDDLRLLAGKVTVSGRVTRT
jgi:hypothetical protein